MMAEQQVTCRRCGECLGCEHHWMEDLTYARYSDDGEPFDGDEPIGDHVCKHCPVVGMTCDECEGEGAIECSGGDDVDITVDCPVCEGRCVEIVPGVVIGEDEEGNQVARVEAS